MTRHEPTLTPKWPDDYLIPGIKPFHQTEAGILWCADNIEIMRHLPDSCIDLTVTSPPYDNLRIYNGYNWNFNLIAKELYRITKIGGVLVWIVNDETIKGSETGNSFRQALSFMEIGYNLHDTMIYKKSGVGACGSNLAYYQSFEYMFVMSKGRPNAINRLRDKINTTAGISCIKSPKQDQLKTRTHRRNALLTEKYGIRENIWEYHTGFFNGDDKSNHPAPFPIKLVKDHVYSWSNAGDLVADFFMGSGTTARAAIELGRRYLGTEISPEYCEIAVKRLRQGVLDFG